MDDKDFEAEMMYRVSVSLAKEMKRKGLASEEEYQMMDRLLLEEYHPALGTLLSGRPLT